MSHEENEIHTLARVRKEVENDAAEKYAKNIEKAKNLWWLIWGLVATTAAGVAWTTSLTINFNNLQKEVDSRVAKFEKIEVGIRGIESRIDSYIASNNLVVQAQKSLTDSLKSSADENRADIKEMGPKVTEMYFRLKIGVTNREMPPLNP